MRAARALSHVTGLSKESVGRLKDHDIVTDDDFWKALSKDAALLSTIPFPDAQAKRRVVETMARHSVQASTSMTRNPLAEHFPDVLITAALLSLLIGIAVKPWRPPATEPQPVVRVVSAMGVPAFHVIDAKDVAAGSSNAAARPVRIVDVVGRYPTEFLAQGAEIDPGKLSAIAAADLASLKLLHVSFATDAALLSLKAPQRIGLAASSPGPSGQPPLGIVLEDVYLLHVQARNDGIAGVIATTPENVQALAPFLASGKLVPIVAYR